MDFKWEPYPANGNYEWACVPLGKRWVITVHQHTSNGKPMDRYVGWRGIAITQPGQEPNWSSRMEEMHVGSPDEGVDLGPLEILCIYHEFVKKYGGEDHAAGPAR